MVVFLPLDKSMKENKRNKKDKCNLDLARELKISLKQEGDNDTTHCWSTWNSPKDH